jgi:hypothetical protein
MLQRRDYVAVYIDKGTFPRPANKVVEMRKDQGRSDFCETIQS